MKLQNTFSNKIKHVLIQIICNEKHKYLIKYNE